MEDHISISVRTILLKLLIQVWLLPNTSLRRCRYTNLLGLIIY
jgi:hypothetical protein